MVLCDVKGGFDGIVVSFSEGCDQDTFRTVFGEIVHRKYVVELTTAGGPGLVNAPVQVEHLFTGDDGYLWLSYFDFDEEVGEPVGDERRVAVSDIIGIEVQ